MLSWTSWTVKLTFKFTIMTIWRWPISKTILDGHSLRAFLGFYDENYISYVEERKISVNKKYIVFIKGSESCLIWKSQCQGLTNCYQRNWFTMYLLKWLKEIQKKDIEYPFPRINYSMLHSCYTTIVCCNNIHGSRSRTHIFIVGLTVLYLFLKKSQLTNLSRTFGPLTSHVRS